MNKKIILSGISFFLLIGCFGCKQTENYSKIPLKNDPQGVSIEASSVNTQNIDNYLFRDDVVYVDLRPYAEIAKEGHIAGFGFYPFMILSRRWKVLKILMAVLKIIVYL